MSEGNVQVVQRYFESTNRGDFAAAMTAYADDVVLVIDGDAIPTAAGTFTGRQAVGDWFADWFRSFARGYQFRVEEARSFGERVLVVARHDARGRASGAAMEWTLAYAFTIRDGKIARLELYRDRVAAIKAM